MKNKKKLVACGLMLSLVLAAIPVSAAEPRAAADCTPSITLTGVKGTFKIYEDTSPMNPNTPKEIVGTYVCVDGLGSQRTQDVEGSLSAGQLVITKNAYANHRTLYGEMDYYLNGRYAGSMREDY